jgi:hypothetical protein
MKHKHAELIKAWADGAKIQILYTDNPQYWEDRENPIWHPEDIYRIKPEPKPDYTTFLTFYGGVWSETPISCYIRTSERALKLISDGETGELKSAEVIK